MKERFGLYLIASNPTAGYESVAVAAVERKLCYLQLRIKDEARQRVLETARMYRDITRGSATRFIVNDDLSVAMEVDADGIHLGQGDLSLSEARRRWDTPGKLFGLSTHSMEQAIQAAEQHPDYIGVGPVFPTRTKRDADPVVGASEAGRIAQEIPATTVAIGGITPANLPGLLAAGADNFCVVSAVNASDRPAKAIRTLQKIWRKHCF